MKKFSSITYRSKRNCVIALGCFDGVHLGHAHVIREAKRISDELGCCCTVWTFDEPPKNYFLANPVPLLADGDEKVRLIKELGADVLVSVPFIKETASMSAESFFYDVLKDRLQAVHLVCGFDYSFGVGGKGNVELLRRLCEECGIGLTVVPAIKLDGKQISSSSIREALEQGQVDRASLLLGRPYFLETVVISGQHLARKRGFPTLNQEVPAKLAVPKHGVYVTKITIKGNRKKFYGITNVGIRPTVGGTALFAETHIFDFTGDLYGRSVKVEFLKFIRPEQKFEGLDALTTQVTSDISVARDYINELNK